MRNIIKKNLYFLIPYSAFIIVGGLLIGFTNKADLHILLNEFHHKLANLFFYYITYLGDGVTAVIVTVILFMVSFRFALTIGISALLSSAITQVLKHTVFSDSLRPKKFFEELLQDINLIPGVENHNFYSFPSGHATTAFSIYFCLALISKNNYLKLTLFFIAFIVSFSRVYLSQHFLEDIYAGSLIGSTVSIIVFCFFNKYPDNSRIDRALPDLFKS